MVMERFRLKLRFNLKRGAGDSHISLCYLVVELFKFQHTSPLQVGYAWIFFAETLQKYSSIYRDATILRVSKAENVRNP